MKSWMPATRTVWGVLQLTEVKVRLPGDTVPSDVLLELSPMVTLAVGWESSTTVNCAVPLASVVGVLEVIKYELILNIGDDDET